MAGLAPAKHLARVNIVLAIVIEAIWADNIATAPMQGGSTASAIAYIVGRGSLYSEKKMRQIREGYSPTTAPRSLAANNVQHAGAWEGPC